MNVFKMQNDKNKLYFANYDRIDESIIFKNVLERLKESSSFTINNLV